MYWQIYISPNYIYPYSARAYNYRLLKEYDKAISDYEKVMELSQENKEFYLENIGNSHKFNLVVDGDIGVKTILAYNSVDKKILLKVLNGLQFMNYVKICERDKSQEVFFNGWMKRV